MCLCYHSGGRDNVGVIFNKIYPHPPKICWESSIPSPIASVPKFTTHFRLHHFLFSVGALSFQCHSCHLPHYSLVYTSGALPREPGRMCAHIRDGLYQGCKAIKANMQYDCCQQWDLEMDWLEEAQQEGEFETVFSENSVAHLPYRCSEMQDNFWVSSIHCCFSLGYMGASDWSVIVTHAAHTKLVLIWNCKP